MVYLDNAATSWPKPESVYRTMDEFQRNHAGSPGRSSHSMGVAAGEVIEKTRTLVCHLINAPEKERVIFTLNCTDALNMGLKGLLRPGDHVITDSLIHNSVVRPLRKLQQQGVSVTRLRQSPGTGVLSASDVKKAITKYTKLLIVTHASNVTGVVQPIEEYGEIARYHNIFFMVDAAQTAGKRPIDVRESNIDLLAFSGHKGLLGPTGTGVLYIGRGVDLDSLREGGTGSRSENEEQPDTLPDRYESGTPNVVGISGLGAGLEFIISEGLWSIIAHGQDLTDLLIEGLSQIREIRLYASEDRLNQAPVVSFNIEGYEPAEVGFILDQKFNIKVRAGLHCAPVMHKNIGTFPLGTVRLSPGYFNTIEEINFTLEAVDNIARSKIQVFAVEGQSMVSNLRPCRDLVEQQKQRKCNLVIA